MFLLLSTARARTWTVDPSGAGDYASMQAAIDGAASGDVLELAAGVYLEGAVVGGKDLSLVGAGSTSTVLGPPGVAVCLDASAGGVVTVEGLALATCDTLVLADSATLSFRDVSLWGADSAGTVTDGSLTWEGGELAYLGGGLAISAGTIDPTDLDLTANESGSPLLAVDGGLGSLTRLSATGNVLAAAALSVAGGAVVVLDTASLTGNHSPWLALVEGATLASSSGMWPSDGGAMNGACGAPTRVAVVDDTLHTTPDADPIVLLSSQPLAFTVRDAE